MSKRVWMVVGALGLGLGPGTRAMQAEAPPRPTLCAAADLVVLGEPTSMDAAWSGDELRPIESTWDFWVDRVVFGDQPAGSVQIVTAGGTVGGLTMTVSEQPGLRLDHRYLVLLKRLDDGRYVVYGGEAGLVPVRRGDGGLGEDEAQAIASLGGCHG